MLVLAAVAVLTVGCAVPKEAGFPDVSKAVEQRTGRKVHWKPGVVLNVLGYLGSALPFLNKPTMKMIDRRR